MAPSGEEFVWAEETFGQVDLGDARRTRRLVCVAASLARAPQGAVMAAMRSSAEREGALRFLANEGFDPDDVGDGVTRATLSRCSGLVYCPVDGASIALRDTGLSRDVGSVGTWSSGGRGLHAVTALAADAKGTPIGILGPQWWARTQRSSVDVRNRRQDLSPRTETRHVLNALTRIAEIHRSLAVPAQLWFQCDRGFDNWPMFKLAREAGLLVTVRSAHDRRIRTEKGIEYLHATAQKAPVLGSYLVNVPKRPDRPARIARMSLRAAQVEIVLQVGSSRTELAPLSVIWADEEDNDGEDRLRWILLTTAHVSDLAGARAVVLGYSTRWLIEDLHRAWKRGWTNVERTQLRRRNSLCKWATIHLALAARALRLSRLARSEPTSSSKTELSREEIDAVLLLKHRTTSHRVGDTPVLADIVLLLAEIGGYDRYSRKPPGPTVIGRGLDAIASLAQGLAIMRKKDEEK